MPDSTPRKWVRAVTGATVVLLVIALISAVFLTVRTVTITRETQQDNVSRSQATAQTLMAVRQIAEQIKSCTTPDGECARRNAQQGRDLAGGINRAQARAAAAAAACADKPKAQTFQQILACTKRRLAQTAP